MTILPLTLEDRLRQEEGGDIAVPYRDSLGNWTAGVGHLLSPAEVALYAEPAPVEVPADVRAAWFVEDVDRARQGVAERLPWTAGLDPVRRLVLEDLAFQLGVDGLLEFVRTLADVEAGDYPAAADEMLRSRWAEQTPNRAAGLAELMRSG